MSGLTKKIVYSDKTLSEILGVNEGALVSYSDISKGVHKYIKERDLKNPKRVSSHEAPVQARPSSTAADKSPEVKCRDCGEPIPAGATFCDMCGVKQ